MHGLQACLFKYITVAAFRIYALHGEDGAKQGDWKLCILKIVMKITLLIMENYGKDHGIVFLNFCGNPEIPIDLPSIHFSMEL